MVTGKEGPSDTTSVEQATLINQYMRWLNNQYLNANVGTAGQLDASVVFGDSLVDRPFLSVIMRTQGKRLEELEEALQSLQNQSSHDFQLIVVGHNVDDDRVEAIEKVLDGFGGWLKQRCAFLLIEGGTRSRPINAALPHAKGRYFAVFDEDDLVYDNWVSSFASLAESHPGHVMYCFVETQDWCVEEVDGSRRLVPVNDSKGLVYCRHPNVMELFLGNHCPLMGLAFPIELVTDFGLRFDERLETTEDWHFLMRAKNVFPFVSSSERVALYRLWSARGGFSSGSVSQDRWKNDAQLISEEFADMPLLFGKGFIDEVAKLVDNTTRTALSVAGQMDMYLDVGEGFGIQHRVVPTIETDAPDAFVFSGLEGFGPILALRIDPQPHGPLAISDFSIEIRLIDGSELIVDPQDTHINGSIIGGQFEFPGDDPQITVPLSRPMSISQVVFKFEKAHCFIQEERNEQKGKIKSLFRRKSREH